MKVLKLTGLPYASLQDAQDGLAGVNPPGFLFGYVDETTNSHVTFHIDEGNWGESTLPDCISRVDLVLSNDIVLRNLLAKPA